MKVKVLRDFRDQTANLKLRKKDEIMEVTKERAEKLAGLGLAAAIQEKETKPEKG